MQDPDAPRRLLALETSTTPGSVAFLRGDRVWERRLPADRATAEALLPAIDALLGEADCSLDELDAFAVSIGPGSFTGLRIGAATVKGLAFGTQQPVAAVPTLAAVALGAPAGAGEGPVVALLDARRGEMYAAGYAAPGDLWPELLPEGLYTAEELARRLPPACRLVGEPLALDSPELARLAPDPSRTVASACAADVGRLGLGLLSRGEGRPAAEIVPRYVRRAEAEVKRTGQATEAL